MQQPRDPETAGPPTHEAPGAADDTPMSTSRSTGGASAEVAGDGPATEGMGDFVPGDTPTGAADAHPMLDPDDENAVPAPSGEPDWMSESGSASVSPDVLEPSTTQS